MKKNKFTPFILGAIVIAIALLVVYATNSKNSSKYKPGMQNQTPTSTTTTTSSTSAQSPKTYTLADVSKHSDRSNCWTTISGSVYDVTSWIAQHPGGAEAIISLCGHDGTAAFTGQHGGQPRPASELAGFKIGTLK